jgi:hypothetical protein
MRHSDSPICRWLWLYYSEVTHPPIIRAQRCLASVIGEQVKPQDLKEIFYGLVGLAIP